MSLMDIDQFTYPTYFTVVGHYMATGEGVTVHLLMGYADDAAALRRQVDDHIESYFSAYAEFFPSLVLLDELQDLVPPKIRGFIENPNSIHGSLLYFAKYHLNRS